MSAFPKAHCLFLFLAVLFLVGAAGAGTEVYEQPAREPSQVPASQPPSEQPPADRGLSATPQAAIDWNAMEVERRANRDRAAAMRQLLMQQGSAIQAPESTK